MASKPKPSARDAAIKSRVFEGASSNTRVFLNADVGTLVTIEGEEVLFPAKCEVLEIQPRLCGDYYADIRGQGFYVASYGASPLISTRNVLAKVPA